MRRFKILTGDMGPPPPPLGRTSQLSQYSQTESYFAGLGCVLIHFKPCDATLENYIYHPFQMFMNAYL